MNNAGIAGGLVAIGIGLATIGLSNFSQSANAVPGASLHAGPEEPQIVWYGTSHNPRYGIQTSQGYALQSYEFTMLMRAWSDGTVEAKKLCPGADCGGDIWPNEWHVISSPTEGLNAAADINFDERVDGADMGALLAAWGNAPRSPIPASDCPLGLMQ